MRKILHPYRQISEAVINLVLADVFLQIINAAFTLLLNFLMLDAGFRDFEITSMAGNRYLTVLLCSMPLAIFVKGKRLKPIMLAGSVSAPVVALLLILAVHLKNTELIRLLMAVWGVAFSLLQILVMPYILLNGKKQSETASIALFFAAGNFTIIICGLFNYVLPKLHPFFNVEHLLVLYSVIGAMGIYFVMKLPHHENLGSRIPLRNFHEDYDWPIIFKALVPTFLIAFGAGFTIPFINLFFKNVHNIGSQGFSLMNTVAFMLVAFGSILIPEIKNRYGYKWSITVFQVMAIGVLFALGTTEWYKDWRWAGWLAAFFFIVRQPLMSIAAPMTSELTMNYVGENNREMISAITAAIWSGSWFASAKIFAILRESDIAYSNIIFITVVLYIIGVAWYYWLITDYEKQVAENRGQLL
ncbi:MAG: MFS transporter [Chitinophagales bacterium]